MLNPDDLLHGRPLDLCVTHNWRHVRYRILRPVGRSALP
jgi:hypothetical protein